MPLVLHCSVWWCSRELQSSRSDRHQQHFCKSSLIRLSPNTRPIWTRTTKRHTRCSSPAIHITLTLPQVRYLEQRHALGTIHHVVPSRHRKLDTLAMVEPTQTVQPPPVFLVTEFLCVWEPDNTLFKEALQTCKRVRYWCTRQPEFGDLKLNA